MRDQKTSYERRNARLIATKVVGVGLAASLAFTSSMPAQAFAQEGSSSSNDEGEASGGSLAGSSSSVLKLGNSSAQQGVVTTVAEAQAAADKAQAEFEQAETEYNNAVADAAAKNTELENAKNAKATAEQELAAAKQATPDASAEAVSNANVLKEDAENAEKASSAALSEAQGKLDAANVAYEGAVGRQTAAQGALAAAQAELTAAESAVAIAQSEVTNAQAELTQAQEQSTAAGAPALKAKLDAAQAALDTSIAAKNNAAAQVGAAQTELTAANTELEACRAAQAAAQTQVDNANAALAASNDKLAKAKTETQKATADLKKATDAENAAKATVTAKQQVLNDATTRVNTAETNKAAADALVAEKEQALANARATASNVNEAREKGLVGMLDWMLVQDGLTQAQKNDVIVAKAVLTKAMNEDFSTLFAKYKLNNTSPDLEPGRNNKVVAIGYEKDAINLDNVLKSLQVMRRINEVRAKDNNFVGYKPAEVNFYFMAGAAAAANRGSRAMTHTDYVGMCEGLAWGYDDPVAGWYDKEKPDFDMIRDELGYRTPLTWDQAQKINTIAKQRGKVVGHYIFLFYSPDQVMGVGFNRYPTERFGKTSEYCATAKGYIYTDASYTVDEFEALVKRYTASIENSSQAVQDAQAALAAAKTQQTNAANAVTAAKNDKTKAAAAVADATKVLTNATKAVASAEELKNQKQQAETDAQKRAGADEVILANAQRILQEKAQAVIAQTAVAQTASEKLEAEKVNLLQAEVIVEQNRQARDKALVDLRAVDQVLADAQSAYDAAQEKLTNAKSQERIAFNAKGAAQTEAANAEAEVNNQQQNRSAALAVRDGAKVDNDTKKAVLATAMAESDRLTKGWKAVQDATDKLGLSDLGLQKAQTALNAAQSKLNSLSARFDQARNSLDTALANLVLAQTNQGKPGGQTNPNPGQTNPQKPTSGQGSQIGNSTGAVKVNQNTEKNSSQQEVMQLDTANKPTGGEEKQGSLAQTGDENDAAGLGVLAALSSAALATFASMRRKKED